MKKNKLRFGDIIAESYYPKEGNNGKFIVFCPGLPGRSNYEDIAKIYVERGCVFIHVKYQGSWESYGRFTMPSCRKTIISFVEGLMKGEIKDIFGSSFDMVPKELFLLGHSFGGSIVLSAGADLKLDGIIALSPVIDYRKQAKDPIIEEEDLTELFDFIKFGFENIYRGIDKSEWENFCKTGENLNPSDYTDKLKTKRILLVHGIKDDSVSYIKTKNFSKLLEKNGADVLFVETDDDHGSIKERPIKEV
ncbi:MAG: prolyl oligopeptidase family serine peptidase, partial [archaeon]